MNLYDFASALEKNLDTRAMIEEIDIGGPCMLRASAKNFHSILVIPDFNDYAEAQKMMEENNMCVNLEFRQRMSAKTFGITSKYDQMISQYLSK